MRQVFTSARIENVEGVARLLQDAGIEVRLTHGRSYKGAIRGNFSYREDEARGPQPAVWIVRSEDQVQARVLLREAGLLETTRLPSDSFLATTVHGGDPKEERATRRRAFRFKLCLLLVIAAVIAFGFAALRKASPDAATAAVPASAPAASPVAAPDPNSFAVDVPQALAAMLLATELDAQRPSTACIAVEGEDAPAALLASLPRGNTRIVPASACPAEVRPAPLRIDIAEYRTDGSGVGNVRLEMSDAGADGQARHESRRLEVERLGDRWRVLRVL